MNNRIHCRNIAMTQFVKTFDMLNNFLDTTQSKKGKSHNEEIESFRLLVSKHIEELESHRNAFINSPRENTFIEDHCKKIKAITNTYQKIQTIEMLNAFVDDIKPKKKEASSKEIESFILLVENYITEITEDLKNSSTNSQKNKTFMENNKEKIEVINKFYKKIKRKKKDLDAKITRVTITSNDLENNSKDEIINTIKNNFLKDEKSKKLIIHDETNQNGEEIIMVGEKKKEPGFIKKWTGRIFSTNNKDEEPSNGVNDLELKHITERDEINAISEDLDSSYPIIEDWHKKTDGKMESVDNLNKELDDASTSYALYNELEERKDLYADNKKTLSNDFFYKISMSDSTYSIKLKNEYNKLEKELNDLSKRIETYHNNKALTKKDHKKIKIKNDKLIKSLKKSYKNMKQSNNLSKAAQESFEKLPDAENIDLSIDTNQSSPAIIRATLEKKLIKADKRTRMLEKTKENIFKEWEDNDKKRVEDLNNNFAELTREMNNIKKDIFTKSHKQYEKLLENKRDALFNFIKETPMPKRLKKHYNTSELDKVSAKIRKNEKFLKKVKEKYQKLKDEINQDIDNFPTIENYTDPNESNIVEILETRHNSTKNEIQRNKEIINSIIKNISTHIDKLREQEEILKERKTAELKTEKVDNSLLELEQEIDKSKKLIESIPPNMTLEEFQKIEKKINEAYDLIEKQLDELDETTQEIFDVIDYDFSIMDRVKLSFFGAKNSLKSAYESLTVVVESKKKKLNNDLTELQKEMNQLKEKINGDNSKITLNNLKEIEDKYSMIKDKWNKLDEKAEEINEVSDYNSTLIAQLGCDLAGLEPNIESLWKTLAKNSISKKFAKEYEDKLSNKEEKTVYFDEKLGKKTYDFDKITKHAVTGSDSWNKVSNLASNLFTSCSSRFFKNSKSGNDDHLSKQGNRSTQTIHHLLNGARNDKDIKAIRPQDNANPLKQINKIRRDLIDQEVTELRASMSSL